MCAVDSHVCVQRSEEHEAAGYAGSAFRKQRTEGNRPRLTNLKAQITNPLPPVKLPLRKVPQSSQTV